MKREIRLRLNKSLVRDYISNPNQTLIELAQKHGYTNPASASYQISKYLKLDIDERKQVLR